MGINIDIGLSEKEVIESRTRYGANELTPPAKTPIWKQWVEKFYDPTIIILCVCAGIAIILGLMNGDIPWDGVAIFVAVAIATLGGTWSEYKADKAFELLKKDSDRVPVKVRREGGFRTVPSTEVVVGDVVLLESGDRVPADGKIVESIDACFDESLMTGESEPVRRKANDDKLQTVTGGTYLVSGSATIHITAVGDSSELGILASSLGRPWVCPNEEHKKHYRSAGKCDVCGLQLEESAEPPTPLQKRLAGLADSISIWGTIAAVLIFVALIGCQAFSIVRGSELSIAKAIISAPVWPLLVFAVIGIAGLKILSLEEKGKWVAGWLAVIAIAVGFAWFSGPEALASVKTVMQFFMVAVTIIVVAVPEGLPLAIVIALGLGMRKIREDNNLVRKMVATETIGSATVICSDKTGTLTLNKMAVLSVDYEKDTDNVLAEKLLTLVGTVNSTAELEHTDKGDRFAGNPTEGAVLAALKAKKINYKEFRAKYKIIDRINFSADLKMMATLVKYGDDSLLLVKGAPERVFDKCVSVSDDIKNVVVDQASKAIRSLAFAYKKLPAGTNRISEGIDSGLTLLAIVGLADPIRDDVPVAVAQCAKAGIDVKMVTGDHPLTAHAIAEKIGMLRPGDIEMTGDEFAAESDESLIGKLASLRVIARAKPATKVRLVELLQRKGEVVAMTGDGTNDAPALRKADVGISMGLRGTDVAKQASDIVLTDDNFGSILKAVHWGRTLYENLQKFVQFQLTVNLSALGIAFVSPIVATLFPNAGFEIQPLTVLQYLWINLIMDTLAAIAFGLEPPRGETLMMKPKSSDEPFLTKTMLMNIVVLGVFFIALILAVEAFDLLGLAAYADKVSPAEFALMKSSVVFNCYVWFQIFHMFNARSVQPGASAFGNLLKSRSFFAIMAFVAIVQFAMVQLGGAVLNTTALPIVVWVKILCLGATAVVVGEILRVIQRVTIKK